jgi:hypothetical protein
MAYSQVRCRHADKKEVAPDVTLQVTGAVAHRNPNTFYKKNEVYLDVVETVNVLISKDGTTLSRHRIGY